MNSPFPTLEIQFRILAWAGYSQTEVSHILGLSKQSVATFARKFSVAFRLHNASKETIDQVRVLHSDGKTNQQIARLLDIGRGQVSRVLTNLGLTPNPTRFLTREEPLRRCVEDGLTYREAAERLGLSKSTVSKLCQTYGIDLMDGRRRRAA